MITLKHSRDLQIALLLHCQRQSRSSLHPVIPAAAGRAVFPRVGFPGGAAAGGGWGSRLWVLCGCSTATLQRRWLCLWNAAGVTYQNQLSLHSCVHPAARSLASGPCAPPCACGSNPLQRGSAGKGGESLPPRPAGTVEGTALGVGVHAGLAGEGLT